MVTSVPIIPEDLDQWNLKVLDSLLKIGRIESETFDFKGPDFKELNVDICAMANTSTGIIVLGISPEKKSGRVIGYQKVGFSPSEGVDPLRVSSNYHYSYYMPVKQIS
jgi:predicted HTH transcriptional regulator